MSSDKKHPYLTRRALMIGAGSAAVGAVLVGRLYYLQFMQGDRYKTLAEGNRIKLHLTPPLRGQILDRLGVVLATNEQNYRMLLRPDQVSNLKETLETIHRLTPLDKTLMESIQKKYKAGRYAPPILLKEFLSWDDVSTIEFNTAILPGVVIEIGQVRYYPYNEKMAHLLGYVGAIAEDDLDDRELLKLPDFKVGKDGVEKTQEKTLRGIPGVKEVEVNVHGLAVRELNTKLSTPGQEVRLTIDARLQEFTVERLRGESAACVVMNVQNGDIITLASVPAFDPNRFSKGITSAYWKELNTNKKVPLMNKTISGQYPPGSTFKMLVGLAAMEAGTAHAGTSVYCPGHFFLGNHRFNCWKPGGHGTVDMRQAIAQSCDTFFYTLAHRMGIDKIAETCHLFGLGETYDLPLLAERTGIVPSPQWKKEKYNQPWQAGDTINASIGQGYVLATPLQMAVMTARIANGGKAVTPRILAPAQPLSTPVFPSIPVKPAHLKVIQEGMWSVVNSPGGTAYGKRIAEEAFMMAGKTGTSQVRRITVRGQDQNSIPWEFRHHAWFVAYAPVSEPRYACALLVEHGGGGSAAAAPIVRDILLYLQQTMEQDAKNAVTSASVSAPDPQEFTGPPAPPSSFRGPKLEH